MKREICFPSYIRTRVMNCLKTHSFPILFFNFMSQVNALFHETSTLQIERSSSIKIIRIITFILHDSVVAQWVVTKSYRVKVKLYCATALSCFTCNVFDWSKGFLLLRIFPCILFFCLRCLGHPHVYRLSHFYYIVKLNCSVKLLVSNNCQSE